jgi:hypothetical protein
MLKHAHLLPSHGKEDGGEQVGSKLPCVIDHVSIQGHISSHSTLCREEAQKRRWNSASHSFSSTRAFRQVRSYLGLARSIR